VVTPSAGGHSLTPSAGGHSNSALHTFSAEVPNLRYVCLSEGVHLRLSIEDKYMLAYNLFPNIDTHIS